MPVLGGRIVIPRFSITQPIVFVMDTGAASTVLAPGDGRRINLDYSQLGFTEQSRGVGGSTASASEPAYVVFNSELAGLAIYRIDLTILKPDERGGLDSIPSLLGRDVLSRGTVVYSPPEGRLTFEVLDADVTVPPEHKP